MDGFFASDSDIKLQEWDALNRDHISTSSLNQYRVVSLGRTPLESVNRIPVATPNPSHKDYSSIEMAKRSEREADINRNRKQTVKIVRIHGVVQRAPWVPKDPLTPFEASRPNISNFRKPLRLNMPYWMH